MGRNLWVVPHFFLSRPDPHTDQKKRWSAWIEVAVSVSTIVEEIRRPIRSEKQ